MLQKKSCRKILGVTVAFVMLFSMPVFAAQLMSWNGTDICEKDSVSSFTLSTTKTVTIASQITYINTPSYPTMNLSVRYQNGLGWYTNVAWNINQSGIGSATYQVSLNAHKYRMHFSMATPMDINGTVST